MDELIRWTDGDPSRGYHIEFDRAWPLPFKVSVWDAEGFEGEGFGGSLIFAAVKALIAYDRRTRRAWSARWIEKIACSKCGAEHVVQNDWPGGEEFQCAGCGEKWVIESVTNPDGGVDFHLEADE